MNYDIIMRDLERNQTPDRFLHIMGVTQTCLSLGEIYHTDLEQLTLVGLLHDCAKHVSREETLQLASEGQIRLSETDRDYPSIWHGAVGAHLARTVYGIVDHEVLEAIEFHTLGCENPSLKLQILMCADYVEPTRSQPGVEDLRTLVRKDLRVGLSSILNHKIEHLIDSNRKPHPSIYKTLQSVEN